jgi:uncharacterized membrane protein HdeD (DUF308 family)
MIEGFLIGVIATASLTAGTIFLRFWRRTRDRLFLAFGATFIIEGINRVSLLMLERPNEGSLVIYGVRLIAFSLIIAAIVAKNLERR